MALSMADFPELFGPKKQLIFERGISSLSKARKFSKYSLVIIKSRNR